MLISDSYTIIFQPRMQSKVLIQATSLIPPTKATDVKSYMRNMKFEKYTMVI